MSTNSKGIRYDEDFKRTLVNLYQSGGKTQTALCKEYGVSQTALTRWIKQYATVEEENLILKKAIAIFTPHSDNY